MKEMPLAIAFKEWAVVCKALADGKQSLILRKGGIAEEGGTFRPEHDRFWLYPTYFHEHQDGIRPEFASLFDAAEAERPPAGTVRLTHFAVVDGLAYIGELKDVLALRPHHIWTQEVVEKRFHYRTPGLFVLMVRIMAAPHLHEIAERPEYAGCKTWVPLDRSLSTDGARPILEGRK